MKRALLLAALLPLTGLHAEVIVPEGYLIQIVNPTWGRIVRPQDWHYSEHDEGPAFVWTFTPKEIPRGGHFETGMRIESREGVQQKLGGTAQVFASDFSDDKLKTATDLGFSAIRQEGFTLHSFETEEGSDHVLYSLFWSHEADLVVVTTARAPKQEWEKYAAIFAVMNASAHELKLNAHVARLDTKAEAKVSPFFYDLVVKESRFRDLQGGFDPKTHAHWLSKLRLVKPGMTLDEIQAVLKAREVTPMVTMGSGTTIKLVLDDAYYVQGLFTYENKLITMDESPLPLAYLVTRDRAQEAPMDSSQR